MCRNNGMGVLGGALIIIASFMVGTGFDFSSDTLDSNTNLVLFLAGIGVVVFLLMGNHNLSTYAAVAAATIGLIKVLDFIRADAKDLSVMIVFLVIGVILALIATGIPSPAPISRRGPKPFHRRALEPKTP